MDNYRHPMYNRYNRNYQDSRCGCGVTPVMETRTGDPCDHHDHHECDCHDGSYRSDKCLEDLPLAMAYVPWQKWRKVCDGAAGLAMGTIFQELNLPWVGCRMRGDRS